MIYQTVCRHGNTLCVPLPKRWCTQLRWKRGDWLIVEVVSKDVIALKKADAAPFKVSKQKK